MGNDYRPSGRILDIIRDIVCKIILDKEYINIYLYVDSCLSTEGYLIRNHLGKPFCFDNFSQTAFLAKCLSDENRLKILLCVWKSKKSVSAIVEELNLSQPLVSHHLKELRRSLLVKVERSGPFVYYELADERIMEILEKLNTLAVSLLSERNTF